MDIQHRISSSKQTMINNFDQLVDNNLTRKTRHSSRRKHSKPESGSEDIYTTSLNNKGIKLTSSISQKQGEIGDYINEESTGIITKTKTPIERIHQLSNLHQQGIGDHHHSNKTTRKYHQELNEENIYRWRLFMYILTIIILAFIIYRFLLTIWPKPKKTLMKQLIDDLFNFFTP
jgi:hypothetical protein